MISEICEGMEESKMYEFQDMYVWLEEEKISSVVIDVYVFGMQRTE